MIGKLFHHSEESGVLRYPRACARRTVRIFVYPFAGLVSRAISRLRSARFHDTLISKVYPSKSVTLARRRV